MNAAGCFPFLSILASDNAGRACEHGMSGLGMVWSDPPVVAGQAGEAGAFWPVLRYALHFP
jgi:hypothetical protein